MVHGGDAGIVDEHVDQAVTPPDLVEHRLHRVLIAHVGAEVLIALERPIGLLAAAPQHPVAASRVLLAEVPADALAGAGDEDGLRTAHRGSSRIAVT